MMTDSHAFFGMWEVHTACHPTFHGLAYEHLITSQRHGSTPLQGGQIQAANGTGSSFSYHSVFFFHTPPLRTVSTLRLVVLLRGFGGFGVILGGFRVATLGVRQCGALGQYISCLWLLGGLWTYQKGRIINKEEVESAKYNGD